MTDFSNIVETKEVISSRTANGLLEQGWILLSAPVAVQGEHETMYLYSLGLPKVETSDEAIGFATVARKPNTARGLK